MKPSTLFFSSLLAISPANAGAEVIDLICGPPGTNRGGRVLLDTEQMAILHRGKPGNIGLITEESIYYYLKSDGQLVSFRLHLSDGVLDMAASKRPPDVGYEHRKQACRRR